MKTSEKIKLYLKEKKRATVSELVDYLLLSRMAVSKQLSNLVSGGVLVKIGKSPKVFYSLAEKKKAAEEFHIDSEARKIIENNFLIITATGERKDGTEIVVPQKTLTKLSDRIENARNTIIVNEKGVFKNVLLIDDAVGSGATLNETALQIKQKGIAKKVIGLSITGSFKGFDVISEV